MLPTLFDGDLLAVAEAARFSVGFRGRALFRMLGGASALMPATAEMARTQDSYLFTAEGPISALQVHSIFLPKGRYRPFLPALKR